MKIKTVDEIYREELIKVRKERVLYELARAIRNVDGHDPHKQGRFIGRALSKLRGIDPVKYDELVLRKE